MRATEAERLPSPTPNRSDSTDAGGRATYHGTSATLRAATHQWPDVPGYEILGVLGRGGMGVVYKARQLGSAAHRGVEDGPKSGPTSARRIWPAFAPRPTSSPACSIPTSSRFTMSARSRAGLILCLEYVAGGSLAQYLDGTPQPARLAAQFVEILARAVHAAHANGVIHRDLKPANILLMSRSTGCSRDRSTTSDSDRSFAGGSVLNVDPQDHRFRRGQVRRSATGTL